MLRLAECYTAVGNAAQAELVYRRLLAQEDSPYERIKGVPEMVDTSYAVVHIHFADEYRAHNDFTRASAQYRVAIARLERWRSNKSFIQVGLYSGIISKADAARNIQMLRSSYLKLADCSEKMGNRQKASEYRRRASAVEEPPAL